MKFAEHSLSAMKQKFAFDFFFTLAIFAIYRYFATSNDPILSQLLSAIAVISILLAAKSQSFHQHFNSNSNDANS